ncbi:hypothetical protein MKZ38_004148 [Zalerion maritima]|uniref:Uncharacterized protein n=1 Tax=Zalerion maritima TaxID=339359 RepID=A0AAD5RLW2_9PEZI|nr:hypothetical protein MKZ38_004148 [Zalerion maritima]
MINGQLPDLQVASLSELQVQQTHQEFNIGKEQASNNVIKKQFSCRRLGLLRQRTEEETTTMPQDHSDTPMPRRFVVQKRQPGSTPLAQTATSRPGIAQFQATPRFGFVSSTPRPQGPVTTSAPLPSSAFPTTPAFPSHGNRPTQALDPIHDSFSPPAPLTSPARAGLSGTQDSIVGESPVLCSQVEVVTETPVEGERASKRRRLSISSQDSSIGLASPSADRQRPPNGIPRPALQDVDVPSLPSDSDEEYGRVLGTERREQDELEHSQRPRRVARMRARESGIRFRAELAPKSNTGATLFYAAPRFVQDEKAEYAQSEMDGHHEVFSPPRRGEKYVRGGLAAELGQWITNSLSNTGTNKTVQVSDSLAGGSMQLIRGHVAQRNISPAAGPETMDVDAQDEKDEKDRGTDIKIILAGDLTNETRPDHVPLGAGTRLTISPPVWDVDIEEDRWKVAYNWCLKSE